jgi:UDP-glucose:(heptosyl)LPS alpha-1,3-glucosyltransferase
MSVPPSPTLRVGFLIDRWDPRRGGAEWAFTTFAAWLEARGHEVLAFGLAGPPPGTRAAGTFVPVSTHGLTRGRRERRLAAVLAESARARGCDVTVGVRHLAQVDLYWPHGGAHAATLRALQKRARGRHRTFLDLERQAVADGGARRVVCVSELVRDELLELYPSSAPRLVVVPNGLDLGRFQVAARDAARAALDTRFGARAQGPLLTFVGRNARLKGLPLLLEALLELESRPWRCVIAGPRDSARWARRVRKGFARPERFLVAPELDALELAAGSDLLVLPSRRETCGLVVLEALACGTPVLVGAAVGAREVLRAPEQGEVLPAELGAGDLAARLDAWLEHLQAGPPDRARIASAVEQRGLEPWMSALEEQLLAVGCRARIG